MRTVHIYMYVLIWNLCLAATILLWYNYYFHILQNNVFISNDWVLLLHVTRAPWVSSFESVLRTRSMTSLAGRRPDYNIGTDYLRYKLSSYKATTVTNRAQLYIYATPIHVNVNCLIMLCRYYIDLQSSTHCTAGGRYIIVTAVEFRFKFCIYFRVVTLLNACKI